MAFSVRKLSVLAYANGFTLWHYKAAPDAVGAVAAEGYFAQAADLFSPGDIMMVSSGGQARMLVVGQTPAKTTGLVPIS